MKKIKKVLLSCLAVLLVGVICYGVWYFNRYVFYDDYKAFIQKDTIVESTEFAALTDSEVNVEGMVLVAENTNFKLYTDTTTGYLAIYDKKSKETIYSNPLDADSDPIAKDINISYLKSQLIVEYYNESLALSVYNSFDHCVAFEQLEMESIPNGIRYIYTLGDTSSATGIVPIYITQERLDQYLNVLNDMGEESYAKYVSKRYKESNTIEGFLELSSAAQTGMATLSKLNKYMEMAGYTQEDFIADMESSGVEANIPMSFVVPVDYMINEDGMLATIHTDQIKENGGGRVAKIQLLRYMDAGTSTEEGYMVLPNGSGSIMNFNNGRYTAADYSQYIYGIDPLMSDYVIVEKTEDPKLSMFGISKQKHDMLVTIEKGASVTSINACVAGKYNSYNFVYPTFFLRGSEIMGFSGQTGNESLVTIIEEDIYDTALSVQYSILPQEYKGYSGMANFYRDQLIADGVLTRQEGSNTLPFYLDVIGAVKRTSYILGSQYRETFSVTDYKEANEIVDELNTEGINRLVMNYQGWFNGGFYHNAPEDIDLVKKLGSEKELEQLSDKVSQNGGRFYADVAFQKVTYISKHFKGSKEASRYYASSEEAIFGQVNPVSLYKFSSLGYSETVYYMLSPRFLPRYVEGFIDDINSIDISGISLRDLGNSLISDKRRTELINREEALDVVKGQFERLKTTGKNLMVDNANDYSFGYATDIINAPLAHNDFSMVNYEIPFYQMILHGCVDYTGTAINLQDYTERNDVILKLLEYGAAPHFTFTYADSTELKYTGLNHLYSTTFANWKQDAVEVYTELNRVLQHVQGATIVEHQFLDLAGGVKKISYDNGVSIYVNTTNKAFTSGDVVIPAKGYEMEGVNE